MKYKWHCQEITNKDTAQLMVDLFKQQTPDYTALDTETTGLHIIMDKPFVVQFGWTDETSMQGYAWAVDLETHHRLGREVVKAMLWAAAQAELFMGHNIKFDLHMLKNIGLDYRKENLTDTMFYIRYGSDAVQESKGGVPLRLKTFATRYIDPSAKAHERLLDQERTAIAAQYNRKLKEYMAMRKKDIDAFFKDVINDIGDLPVKKREGYQAWYRTLPDWLQQRINVELISDDIPYHKLNRKNLITYALNDIVWTLEIFHALRPVIDVRSNQEAIDFENKLILPLLDMERVGFNIDTNYLEESRLKMKQYIRERREHLYGLAGQEFTIGQHALIKQILANRFGLRCDSTNSDALSRIESDLIQAADNGDDSAVEFIKTLQELRTLEKWYATYILRFQRDLRRTDRLFTTINQVGTVSGRVTSDFQQFPKDSIRTIDGEELFNPRRMIVISDEEDYDALVYIDYSQIELRLQAMYTLLVQHPEPNLLRAYMPFGCRDKNGRAFDPQDKEHIARWQEKWFLDESPTVLWQPIDVHAATTCHAFNITPDHPDFKKLRYHGKRINFAKNYGAQFGRIRQMFPDYTTEQIRQIDQAYYKAFPGVRAYHDYCNALAMSQAYGMNLFGVKYYNVSGHNLINMLIQGSGAFLLKWKIRQLWEYSQKHQIKSRMQMNIHDEISWEKHKNEDEVFFVFKNIMESWADTLVPIVADMEVSYTSWADKKGVESIDDLRCNNEETCHTNKA